MFRSEGYATVYPYVLKALQNNYSSSLWPLNKVSCILDIYLYSCGLARGNPIKANGR